jgi:hypothetical protein
MSDPTTPSNPLVPGDKILNPDLLEFGIRSELTVVHAYRNGNIVARKPGFEIRGHHETFTRAEEES